MSSMVNGEGLDVRHCHLEPGADSYALPVTPKRKFPAPENSRASTSVIFTADVLPPRLGNRSGNAGCSTSVVASGDVFRCLLAEMVSSSGTVLGVSIAPRQARRAPHGNGPRQPEWITCVSRRRSSKRFFRLTNNSTPLSGGSFLAYLPDPGRHAPAVCPALFVLPARLRSKRWCLPLNVQRSRRAALFASVVNG